MTYRDRGDPAAFFEAYMIDNHTPEMTKNHRARAREKLLSAGRGEAGEELVLEVYLYDLLPRIDTYPAAHRLLERFGSLEGVFSASAEELSGVHGIGRRSAERIAATGAVIDRAVLERFTAFPLDTEYRIFPVLTWLLKNADADCKLIIAADADAKYLTHCSFSPDAGRKETERFVSRTARRGGVKFIFAHKHPDGFSEPSADDVAATVSLRDICAECGAELFRHFIVTDAGLFDVPVPGEEK